MDNELSRRLSVLADGEPVTGFRRARLTGWPLGKTVRVKWKDGSLEGLVLERSVNADNLEGEWVSELLLERVV